MRRFNVLVCHRRFGKTVLCINELIDQALRTTNPAARYAYLAPLYRQAKQAAWDFLKLYSSNIPGIKIFESELKIDYPNGARIQLFGADNPDALRGMGLDGVVLDEYAQMPPGVWTEIIRPMLATTKGWAVFIGTPKGRNAFCEMFEEALERMKDASSDWFAVRHKASETGVLSHGELMDMRQDMSSEEYDQELECSFSAAIVGAYYGGIIADLDNSGRIRSVPYDPAYPVHTGWDLGIGDSTAIWFTQTIGTEIHWIDYYENSGVGLDHYVKVLQGKPYIYGDHFLPHDAAAKELGTGKSRMEVLQNLGVRGRIIPQHSVDDGINNVRMYLARSWFDKDKCDALGKSKERHSRGGLEALRQYKKKWDDKNGVFRAAPLHDWSSHAADAARYMCMGLKEPSRMQGFSRIPNSMAPRAVTDYSVFG